MRWSPLFFFSCRRSLLCGSSTMFCCSLSFLYPATKHVVAFFLNVTLRYCLEHKHQPATVIKHTAFEAQHVLIQTECEAQNSLLQPVIRLAKFGAQTLLTAKFQFVYKIYYYIHNISQCVL